MSLINSISRSFTGDGEVPPLDRSLGLTLKPRQVDLLVHCHSVGDGVAVSGLEFLGDVEGYPHGHGQVPGNLVAAHGEDRRVPRTATPVNDDVCSATADVHQYHTHLPLILTEDRLCGGQGLMDQATHRELAPLHRPDHVLEYGCVSHYHVGIDLDPVGVEVHGVPHAGQPVHDVAHGDHMQDFLAVGHLRVGGPD